MSYEKKTETLEKTALKIVIISGYIFSFVFSILDRNFFFLIISIFCLLVWSLSFFFEKTSNGFSPICEEEKFSKFFI